MSKLPPVGEIAALMSEELAPFVLQDLVSLGTGDRCICLQSPGPSRGPASERARKSVSTRADRSRVSGVCAPCGEASGGAPPFLTGPRSS